MGKILPAVVLGLSLTLTQRAASGAFAQARPAMTASAADIAPCIWRGLPAGDARAILGAATMEDTVAGIQAAAGTMGNDRFWALLTGCGVTEQTSGKAGELFGGYVGRLWSEGKLSARWSATTLDRAYGQLKPAEIASIVNEDAGSVAAAQRFFGLIGAGQPDSDTTRLLLAYLISRGGYDRDVAAFGR